ncbi:unnamed protein product [Acanthoscelides obtectus]|uniref:ERAP1-like C-terminal domain-containing protein n=1 Tax=Acanthoscelides obtectus TaxID=200917 RepID=A0A9P0KG52_ACAOB|nr:unnamed protein product [Acanthoscelides obtectus]CAK1664719.1 Aminopeptidase N [Acanthoscelides obtectus]
MLLALFFPTHYDVSGIWTSLPHRDLRSLVYCNGIRYSENVKDWDFLWNQYESNVTSEQEAILSGLACTKDPSLLKRLLLKTIDDSTKMRAQDAWTAFSSIYRSSSEGVDAAVVFFAENYNKIVEKYKSMLVIGDLLVDAASRVTNDQSLARLMAFVEEANKMHKEIAPKAEEAVKSAETNLKMIRNCKSDINKYFYNTACKSSVSNFLGLCCIAFCIVRLF